MNTRKRALWTIPALAVGAMFAISGPASAAESGSGQADLAPITANGVHGSGTAMVWVKDDVLTVQYKASGLVPGMPHAAHIHYAADSQHMCPTIKDDKNGDGHINVTEGMPVYGDIQVSLTTSGDTSAKSALAVDRFPTAKGGDIDYQRGSIKVSDAVAKDILSGGAAIVVHGVDYNNDGKYDGSTKSDLDKSLPTEATDPALCGIINASQMSTMPSGGAQTGDGSTSGTENMYLFVVGGAALVAGGGALAVRSRRRTASDRS
jgi:LPXTG-motif cell wall-anchored protein